MKRQAKDVRKGNSIILAGKKCSVVEVERSEIGKHGKRKVRILATTPSKERVVVIRPEDYPFEIV